MNVLRYLTIMILFLSCGSASADNWRDDNPNQPNGYAASMYRYHHGTPDDDGPHDGYRATEARSRYGLDRFAPPDKDDSDSGSRWGGGGDSDSGRWGSGGGSGSGLGRHFRQGQAESQTYWKQRLESRMQSAGGGMGMQSAGYGNSMRTAKYGNGGPYPGSGMGQMQNFQNNPAYGNQQAQQFQRFNVNNQVGATSGNSQYAPASGGYNNNGYATNTALQHAVSQKPFRSLLRNSQGGFNQIYYPHQ